MTIREAFSEIQGMLQNYAPENMYPVAARHIKHASLEFSRTPALIQTITIPLTGAASYALPLNRIARIYHVEHNTGSQLYAPRLVQIGEMNEVYTNPTTGGSAVDMISIYGRSLRSMPLVSGSTLTIYASVVPVMSLRDTPRNKVETATGGSVTTVAASTITHGIVNNRGGITDYFTGCKIVFDTGSTLATQYSYITSANEGASAITFTFSPAVSAAVTTETFHIEDVVEVPDQYATACVDYAAGMVAALDSKAGALASRFLQSFDALLLEAKGKPPGWQPAAKFRVRDYMEGSRNWVS